MKSSTVAATGSVNIWQAAAKARDKSFIRGERLSVAEGRVRSSSSFDTATAVSC